MHFIFQYFKVEKSHSVFSIVQRSAENKSRKRNFYTITRNFLLRLVQRLPVVSFAFLKYVTQNSSLNKKANVGYRSYPIQHRNTDLKFIPFAEKLFEAIMHIPKNRLIFLGLTDVSLTTRTNLESASFKMSKLNSK